MTATDQQVGPWRALRPRRLAVQRFAAQWWAETGTLPTVAEVARALGVSWSRARHLVRYQPVAQRKKKRPARQYAGHVRAVPTPARPVNTARLAQARALFRVED